MIEHVSTTINGYDNRYECSFIFMRLIKYQVAYMYILRYRTNTIFVQNTTLTTYHIMQGNLLEKDTYGRDVFNDGGGCREIHKLIQTVVFVIQWQWYLRLEEILIHLSVKVHRCWPSPFAISAQLLVCLGAHVSIYRVFYLYLFILFIAAYIFKTYVVVTLIDVKKYFIY